MSLSAVAPDAAADLSLRATLGIGPGEVFVALSLIYVLGFLYLLGPMSIATERKRSLRALLLGCAIPLGATFLGVVLYTSFTLV